MGLGWLIARAEATDEPFKRRLALPESLQDRLASKCRLPHGI